MAPAELPSLRSYLGTTTARFCWDRDSSVRLSDLNGGTSLGRGRIDDFAGRSVLLATANQLTAALALIELDGHARRITVLPPDFKSNHLAAIIGSAEIDAVVVDCDTPRHLLLDLPIRVISSPSISAGKAVQPARLRTEWILLTSGTSGPPKLVAHTLSALTAPMASKSPADGAAVWGTFYDIRRYGGLQIFLRALMSGASLVLSRANEPVSEHLARLAQRDVTHISGTPSHWRAVLMNPEIRRIAPRYVRLSGEIADQTILDSLRAVFPQASVGHAYASTEAGVAFDVNDGLAGFPVAYLSAIREGVEMKIVDGALHIRSPRTASHYVGNQGALTDEEGFVDTGDLVEQHGDRYYFVGRKDGVINIGGLKVHPEEIEAVINTHPMVRQSVVQSKKSPITGSIAVAEIVLKPCLRCRATK
jgi:acyl-coenzyme A synthetase/AMP-(fatty) acid ligase